jgi:dihydroneopterin aldolase
MTQAHYSPDRIFLHGLTAECVIGFIDWERRVKQTVVMDIELPVAGARRSPTPSSTR